MAPIEQCRAPGCAETIVFRSRLALEDVRRFLEAQLRVFYDRHGHTATVETWPWGPGEITDSDQRRKLPDGALRHSYDHALQTASVRSFLLQRASDFCVALVARGRQDHGHTERDELVTRIFDATLLQDALGGFHGPLTNPVREFWILSRNWTDEHATKHDKTTNTTISMRTFSQRWLVHRDLAVSEAERRLASRDAAKILDLARHV